MNEPAGEKRLSEITTQWSQFIKAHQDASTTAVGATRSALLQRYIGAVYRYLLGALRSQEAAEDLSHDFVVRFLRGDFHRADSERGRFRDYLKSALINMVIDYHRQQKDRPCALESGAQEPAKSTHDETDSEAEFAQCWREELLEQTWAALEANQADYYAVLRMRAERPEVPASELVAPLSEALRRSMTPGSVRKTIERARARFADLLVQEVAASLPTPDASSIEVELKELNLLTYCRTALDRRE